VTYLPFHRLHEIIEFFAKNVEVIRPEKAVAFVDNVYHEKQKELALKLLPRGVDYVFGIGALEMTRGSLCLEYFAETTTSPATRCSLIAIMS
jgi:hypothetical protein